MPEFGCLTTFRTRLVTVDAEQFNPDDVEQCKRFGIVCSREGNHGLLALYEPEYVDVCPGDWIVTHCDGKVSVWKNMLFDDIFEKLQIGEEDE